MKESRSTSSKRACASELHCACRAGRGGAGRGGRYRPKKSNQPKLGGSIVMQLRHRRHTACAGQRAACVQAARWAMRLRDEAADAERGPSHDSHSAAAHAVIDRSRREVDELTSSNGGSHLRRINAACSGACCRLYVACCMWGRPAASSVTGVARVGGGATRSGRSVLGVSVPILPLWGVSIPVVGNQYR